MTLVCSVGQKNYLLKSFILIAICTSFHQTDWQQDAHASPDFPIALAREVFARLCTSLPPPRDGTPEARAVRDDLAYAAVGAYYPVDAGEAELAVQIVAANAHALDSLGSPACRGSRRKTSAAAVPREIR